MGSVAVFCQDIYSSVSFHKPDFDLPRQTGFPACRSKGDELALRTHSQILASVLIFNPSPTVIKEGHWPKIFRSVRVIFRVRRFVFTIATAGISRVHKSLRCFRGRMTHFNGRSEERRVGKECRSRW